MANFIPPANGASLGSYFCVKICLQPENKGITKREFLEEAHIVTDGQADILIL